jgi:hypothetical protein
VSVPLALFALVRPTRGGDHTAFLPVVCLTVHAAYLIRLGGDLFEFRLLDPYWPLLAVPFAEGVLFAADRARVAAARFGPRLARGAFAGSALALTAIALAYEVAIPIAKHRELGAARGYAAQMGVHLTTADLFGGLLPGAGALLAMYQASEAFLVSHCIALSAEEHALFARLEASYFRPCEAAAGKGIVPRDAVEAYPWIGVKPFYLPDLTVIDEHGLTDRVIAHTPYSGGGDKRCMAHEKLPPPGYLESRGVNFEAAGCTADAASALRLGRYAVPIDAQTWLAFDSPDPAWVARAFAGRSLLSREARTP